GGNDDKRIASRRNADNVERTGESRGVDPRMARLVSKEHASVWGQQLDFGYGIVSEGSCIEIAVAAERKAGDARDAANWGGTASLPLALVEISPALEISPGSQDVGQLAGRADSEGADPGFRPPADIQVGVASHGREGHAPGAGKRHVAVIEDC